MFAYRAGESTRPQLQVRSTQRTERYGMMRKLFTKTADKQQKQQRGHRARWSIAGVVILNFVKGIVTIAITSYPDRTTLLKTRELDVVDDSLCT